MEPREMKVRWPSSVEDSEYMRMRQRQNMHNSLSNHNENWFAEKLTRARIKYRRQAQWGFRLFDFWIASKGVAVEIDGPEHNAHKARAQDAYRDEYNYRRSAILVIRVPNGDEASAAAAIQKIHGECSWEDRRAQLGLNLRSKKARRKWVAAPELTETLSLI